MRQERRSSLCQARVDKATRERKWGLSMCRTSGSAANVITWHILDPFQGILVDTAELVGFLKHVIRFKMFVAVPFYSNFNNQRPSNMKNKSGSTRWFYALFSWFPLIAAHHEISRNTIKYDFVCDFEHSDANSYIRLAIKILLRQSYVLKLQSANQPFSYFKHSIYETDSDVSM